MSRHAPVFICLMLIADSAFGQGEVYESPFTDYSYTINHLLQNPKVVAASHQPAASATSTTSGNRAAVPAEFRTYHVPLANQTSPQFGAAQPWVTPSHSGIPIAIPAQQPLAGHTGGQPAVHGHSCDICTPSPDLMATVPCTDCTDPVFDSFYPSPCDECGRQFAFQFDFALVQRGRPDGQTLFSNPASTTENIGASQFSPDTTPGVESSIIWYDPMGKTDFELRGLWLDEWTSRVDQRFTGPTVQIAANPVLGITAPLNGAAFYASQFGSAELNARFKFAKRNFRSVVIVGGLRYVNLNENLNGTLADLTGITSQTLQTSVDNDLFGLQIGLDAVIADKLNWCLKLDGRVGVLGNEAQQRTEVVSLAAPPVTLSGADDSGDLAFLAEVGISAKVKLLPRVNFTAGLKTIYLDGLALAPEQLGTVNFVSGSGIHTSGDLLLHTATAGLELFY